MTKPLGFPPTPELDKMGKIRDESQAIGEFLDWLRNARDPVLHFGQWTDTEEVLCHQRPPEYQRQADDLVDLHAELAGTEPRQASGHPSKCACKGTGWVTISLHREEFRPVSLPIQKILAEYFEIDENKAEGEREAVLEYARTQNGVQ